MSATFFKATIDGKTRYIPVAAIRQAVVESADEPTVRLVTEKGDHYLRGEEAAAALASLDQLSQADPAEQSS